MRKLVVTLIAAALVASLATSAMAVINWQFVEKSAYKLSNPAAMNDWQRIRFHSMVADSDGNVFAACNNLENGTYDYGSAATSGPPSYTPQVPAYTDAEGGITIIKTDGTKRDVKLCALTDPTWSNYWWGPDFLVPPYAGRGDNRYAGTVTKLVKGGDGHIYALMNWLEIHWDNPRQNQRIIRIRLVNGEPVVDPIWTPPTDYAGGPGKGTGAYDIRYSNGQYVWVQDGGSQYYNMIRGLTVGGDGNIYWTMNGASNYWKYRTLWRYNVSTGEVTEAGSNGSGTQRINNGWSETHRMFDLEYVGNDYFAIINAPKDNAEWRADSMRFEKGTQVTDTHGWGNTDYPGTRHMGAPVPIGSTNRPYVSNPGWGRDMLTAAAYDQDRKRLWAAGRGTGSGPWGSNTNGGSFTIIDLGGGNSGIQAVSSPTPANKTYYIRNTPRPIGKLEITLAAKFRLDTKTSDYNGSVLVNIPDSNVAGQAGPRIAVAADPATGKWRLLDVADPAAPISLKSLGDTTTGAFNTAYVYVKDKANVTDTVRVVCWWNGSKAYDSDDGGEVQPRAVATGPYVNFGVRCDWPWTTQTGTATATFDWVGYAEQMVTPSDPWPTNLIAGNMDGSIYPNRYVSSNIMTRWNGADTNSGLFNALVWTSEDPVAHTTSWATEGITSSEVWHTNGNDPQASAVPNGGLYWPNTLAINPDDGSCWSGWSAESSYVYPDRGNVMVRGLNLWELFDAGAPEPGADVVGLTFHKPAAPAPGDPETIVYALVCNRTSGDYSIYKAGASSTSPFDYYQYMPLNLVRFHRRGVLFSLDTPKVVTYTNQDQRFFYIEDVNDSGVPESGIKVLPGNDGVSIPGEIGGAVSIVGYLDVVDGEAVIRAFGVSAPEAGTLPTPLTMRCNAVGGDEAGAQSALAPVNGPSNVGLLVQVAGTVAALDPTNQFDPQWFTVDDGTGGVTYYLDELGNVQSVPGLKIKLPVGFTVNVGSFVSVIGVSSVDALIYQPDPQTRIVRKIQRSVLPRDSGDLTVY